MKKLILIISVFLSSLVYSQESSNIDVPFEIYGIWQSFDNEFLRISRDLDGKTIFQRINGRTMQASGTLSIVNGEMHIVRADKKDEYTLAYFIGESTMVITKPRSGKAWLWSKVGN